MAITWEKDYPSSLARARSENKPVFMDFFSPT